MYISHSKRIVLLFTILLLMALMTNSKSVDAQGRIYRLTVANGYRLTVANGSSRDIHRLHMSSSRTGNWGPDMLGRSILRVGESRPLGDMNAGEYDILAIDIRENQCVKRNVTIFRDVSVTIDCF